MLQTVLPFPLPVPKASPEQTSSGFPPVAIVSFRDSGFGVLFSPMTTTQLCTPGKASSLDKSFPVFLRTSFEVGWLLILLTLPFV